MIETAMTTTDVEMVMMVEMKMKIIGTLAMAAKQSVETKMSMKMPSDFWYSDLIISN